MITIAIQLHTLINKGDIILTNSFTEFLRRFLRGGVFETGGLYDWRDEIIKLNS
jgi:hypothetical protein